MRAIGMAITAHVSTIKRRMKKQRKSVIVPHSIGNPVMELCPSVGTTFSHAIPIRRSPY
jgi:hypothetical protein